MHLYESFSVLGDWFEISFIENSGAAWGMELGGQFGKLFLSIFRLVACGFIVYYIQKLRKRKAPTGVVVALVVILIGALGNVLDSAFYGMIFTESTASTVAQLVPLGQGYGTFLHGKVVDMLYFPIIRTDSFTFFPAIFNLADAYISVAMFYLVIFHWRYFSDKPNNDQ